MLKRIYGHTKRVKISKKDISVKMGMPPWRIRCKKSNLDNDCLHEV